MHHVNKALFYSSQMAAYQYLWIPTWFIIAHIQWKYQIMTHTANHTTIDSIELHRDLDKIRIRTYLKKNTINAVTVLNKTISMIPGQMSRHVGKAERVVSIQDVRFDEANDFADQILQVEMDK